MVNKHFLGTIPFKYLSLLHDEKLGFYMRCVDLFTLVD